MFEKKMLLIQLFFYYLKRHEIKMCTKALE